MVYGGKLVSNTNLNNSIQDYLTKKSINNNLSPTTIIQINDSCNNLINEITESWLNNFGSINIMDNELIIKVIESGFYNEDYINITALESLVFNHIKDDVINNLYIIRKSFERGIKSFCPCGTIDTLEIGKHHQGYRGILSTFLW